MINDLVGIAVMVAFTAIAGFVITFPIVILLHFLKARKIKKNIPKDMEEKVKEEKMKIERMKGGSYENGEEEIEERRIGGGRGRDGGGGRDGGRGNGRGGEFRGGGYQPLKKSLEDYRTEGISELKNELQIQSNRKPERDKSEFIDDKRESEEDWEDLDEEWENL